MLGLVNSDFAVVILDSIGFGLVVQLLMRGLVGLFLDSSAVFDTCLQHTIRATDVHGMEVPHLGPCDSIAAHQSIEGFKSRRLETLGRGVNKDLPAIRSDEPWLTLRTTRGSTPDRSRTHVQVLVRNFTAKQTLLRTPYDNLLCLLRSE